MTLFALPRSRGPWEEGVRGNLWFPREGVRGNLWFPREGVRGTLVPREGVRGNHRFPRVYMRVKHSLLQRDALK
jgi:hypothetical protein